jgi:hypothetical protein
MNINGIEYTIAEINRIVINYEKILQSKRQNWHKKKLEPVSEKLEPVRKWIPKIPTMLPLGISDPEFKVR